MLTKSIVLMGLAGAIGIGPLCGCDSLPGNKGEQGAVIGGVGGAATGALVAKNNRGIGALIGGALGAGGGYLIGAQLDKNDAQHRDEAVQASQRAERNPANKSHVRNSDTADLNNDGYVTMDEVIAMRQAGLSDQEMIDRLRRSNEVFELTDWQRNYLSDHGVDARVIDSMLSMNRDIGRPAP